MKSQQNQTTTQGLMPTFGNQQQRMMSSREIAELCEKRHDNVMRDCLTMFKNLEIDALKFEETYIDRSNRKKTEYLLSEELTMTLITGYNVILRNRVIKRWKELEEQVAQPIDPMQALSDPNTLRSLLLGYSEKMLELENKVGDMQNTVNAHERLTKAEGSLCITDSAKTLQVNPKRLFALLSEKKWIYKRVGSAHWVGYQDKVQIGYLEHKITEVTRGDGTTKITEQVRITPKGLTKISQLLSH